MRMLVALSLGLAISIPAGAGGKEPYVGTWRLDVARTTYDPGPVPRSGVDVITTTPDGSMHVVHEWVAVDGRKTHAEWTARFDGKDYPVTGGVPGTTISMRRPDPRDPWTYDWVWKVPGVSTTTGRTVFARDGKTRVVDDKVVTGSGKATVRHRVYVREGVMRVATPVGEIAVEAGGAGPGVPVLFLHGLGVNRSSWRAQLDHLWKTRRAAAFDSLGCGDSDSPSDGVYTVAARADAIGLVADALGYDRFVLVGASYGGLVAGLFAAENPARVAGVVLADGALDPSTWPPGQVDAVVGLMRSDWDEAIARGFTPSIALASEEVRSAAHAALAATPRRTVIEGYANLKGWDARTRLARYPGPKLSIFAETLDEPGAVHHTLPIPSRVMKGVSHMLMMDRPEEFDAILDGFLAGLP